MSLAISRTVTRPPYGWAVVKALIELADIPVTRLAGVGPAKAEGLAELGIETVLDLLLHYPRRYVDRTKQATIRDMKVGEEATILATVRRVAVTESMCGPRVWLVISALSLRARCSALLVKPGNASGNLLRG